MLSISDIKVSVPSNISEEIKNIINEINRLKDAFKAVNQNKLNSQTFSSFQGQVGSKILELQKRVSNLENVFGGFIDTLNTASKSSFNSWITDVNSNLNKLLDTTKGAVNAIDAIASSGGTKSVKIIDDKDLDAKRVKLEKIIDLLENGVDGKIEINTNDIKEALSFLDEAFEKYEDAASKFEN